MIGINKKVFWCFKTKFKFAKLIVRLIDKQKIYELNSPYNYYLRLVEKNSLKDVASLLKLLHLNILPDLMRIEERHLKLGIIYD